MEKEKVLKALETCSAGIGCTSCPYEGMDFCDTQMCQDAHNLLKANEAPKAKYSLVYIFTKHTNLSKYCTEKVLNPYMSQTRENMVKYYAQEREVQLVCKFRWEKGKCYCKIDCPINPMPVKGEFITPGTPGPVLNFLVEHGWVCKQKATPNMSKMFE